MKNNGNGNGARVNYSGRGEPSYRKPPCDGKTSFEERHAARVAEEQARIAACTSGNHDMPTA